MKKLLSLLNVLTISVMAVPTTIATSSYQKENKKLLNSNIKKLKRVKRNDVPSLQDLITTINIGKIKKVNQKNILKRLSEINHPIVSRTDFLKNIEFENITANSAIIRARQNILYPFNHCYSIPSLIRFIINFDSNIVNFNEILGLITEQFILKNNLNNLLTINDLRITNITNSSALIESLNVNYIISLRVMFVPLNIIYFYSPEKRRTVSFQREPWSSSPEERNNIQKNKKIILSLSSVITNTDLGTILDNRPETILREVILTNPRNNSLRVDSLRAINITSNSATITSISENFIGSVIVNFTVDRNFNYYKRSQNFYDKNDKDNLKKENIIIINKMILINNQQLQKNQVQGLWTNK
ncbi:hypothetical protein [Spiroplasma endosymbiont of Seladonia tumulorum]|uniref:hypothetical protein n=1 Tax=Spiroplasma endosymbiont of Seladonia tumulorum TaxID=3066321 RepID=UPI0030D5DDD5